MTQSPAEALVAALQSSLADDSFVRLTLRTYRGADDTIKSLDIRKVVIKGADQLSFTWHHKTRDIIKNHAPKEGVRTIAGLLEADFRGALLLTTAGDVTLENGKLRRKPASQTQPVARDHDRAKQRLIAASADKPYLHALGVTDADGQVLKSAQDKYRQINRYIEILAGLIRDAGPSRIRRVADMGSGKGYLTFALYDYLANSLGQPVSVTGVEFRQDMVDLCNDIARRSGFSGLGFSQGSIADFDATDIDLLIALHACDTATDDAIYKGIEARAELIVVAPCCHKQIRRQIEAGRKGNELDFLTRHGIFLERQAEMVTDGLRALLLEYAGYQTKVFEFISDAHTPKNVLIVASRTSRTDEERQAIARRISGIKDYFGIGYHHLERLMGLTEPAIPA